MDSNIQQKKENQKNRSRSRSLSKEKEEAKVSKHNRVQQLSTLEKLLNYELKSNADQLQTNFICHFIFETETLKPNDNPVYNKNVGNNDQLNQIKNKINPYEKEWDKIKLMLNDYELIDIHRNEGKAINRYALPQINYNIKRGGLQYVFSRAYFKLWEVLKQYNVLNEYIGKKLNIATIAEGPGGFIHSLIDYRQQQFDPRKHKQWNLDNYYAITLKIQDPEDQRSHDWSYPPAKNYFDFMKTRKNFNINLSYGLGDGNMLNTDNLRYFIEKDLKNQKCELVTGDGGIEVSGEAYDLQELCNVKLFYSEILTAFSINTKGGTFILKIYDSFFELTLQLLELLCRFYKNVNLTKPLTSRPASSERYVVCEGFLGISSENLKQLFDILDQWAKLEPNIMDYLKNDKKVKQILKFPEDNKEWKEKFEKMIKESNELCMLSQISKIEKGLKYCEVLEQSQNELGKLKDERIKEQIKYAQLWCDNYSVPKIEY